MPFSLLIKMSSLFCHSKTIIKYLKKMFGSLIWDHCYCHYLQKYTEMHGSWIMMKVRCGKQTQIENIVSKHKCKIARNGHSVTQLGSLMACDSWFKGFSPTLWRSDRCCWVIGGVLVMEFLQATLQFLMLKKVFLTWFFYTNRNFVPGDTWVFEVFEPSPWSRLSRGQCAS